MGQITVYPRFYTSRSEKGEGIIESKGDSTINTLYELFISNQISTTNWQFHRLVLENAIRLFGNFDQWCSDQFENPQIIGYNEDFIRDCIEFTRTGKRQLRIENWVELMTQVDVHTKLPVSEIKSRASNGTARSTVEVLTNWAAWPNGMEDLVCSLRVFFGRVK